MVNPFEEIMAELKEIKTLLLFIQKAPAEPVEIIDRVEAMKRLNITEPTIIRWGKRGKIPEIRIGSSVRYNWYAVVKSLENKN